MLGYIIYRYVICDVCGSEDVGDAGIISYT